MPDDASTAPNGLNAPLASEIRDASATDVGAARPALVRRLAGCSRRYSSRRGCEAPDIRKLPGKAGSQSRAHADGGFSRAAARFLHGQKGRLYQLYVAKEARGLGVAGRLLADSERRLLADGVATAWLACAIGNARAERFNANHGWMQVGPVSNELDLPGGVCRLTVWRYEKHLLRDT